MIIKNRESLVSNGSHHLDKKARGYALTILEEGVKAADPRQAITRNVTRRGDELKINGLTFNLSQFENVYVLGAGKASGAMAEAIEEVLGDKITAGFVNVNLGSSIKSLTGRITLNEASHPIPSEDGMRGTKEILRIAEKAGERDLILYLISGGGSALAPLPADGLTLRDKMDVTSILLKSGATINELNTVRKHLSAIKGGRLAKAAYPATLVGLVISDVIGDPLDIISSGPTTPDPSTFAEAKEILEKYGLWKEAPERVRKHLEEGCSGRVLETPKEKDEAFKKVNNVVVASSNLVMVEMEKAAAKLRLNTLILSSRIEGEAREVGKVLASIATEAKLSDNPAKKPLVIIGGGETTVTVRGKGLGGRNQELTLGAATKISDLNGVVVTSMGSDGLDGPTDAAGALVDGKSLKKALQLGLKPYEYLKENDSYNFFKRLGDLILTGPTGTNVNDFMIMVILQTA